LIYLALPYTSSDSSVVDKRFHDACEAYSILVQKGSIVLCPILMSHPVALKYDLPGDWEFWKEIDLAYLHICSSMYVLTLEGWEISVGVTAEITEAQRLGMPVTLLSLDSIKAS
jgi:hypothetical protein